MSGIQESEREPALERLNERVGDVRDAALRAVKAETWRCSDGHEHPRPETFTTRRLATEIECRNPRRWSSAEISLGIWRLVDEGALSYDTRWRLSIHV